MSSNIKLQITRSLRPHLGPGGKSWVASREACCNNRSHTSTTSVAGWQGPIGVRSQPRHAFVAYTIHTELAAETLKGFKYAEELAGHWLLVTENVIRTS